MHALDILRLLATYQSMILSASDELGIKSEPGNIEISSAYSFITLDIYGGERNIVCRVCFELDKGGAKLAELYCEDKSLTEQLRTKLSQKKFPGFEDRNVEALAWSDKIRSSVEQADSIAALSVDCTTGDSYRPGNFSKITIYHDRIELQQINMMNAKSLAHKTNYSLRSLEFFVPLSKELRAGYAQQKLGDMVVEFSDRSSENNRRCGDRISEALEQLTNDKK